MSTEDIEEWLDTWVEDHLAHGAHDLDAAVALCLKEAEAIGLSAEALIRAARGDLAAFLAEEGEAIRQAGV
ncbi:hypothetical protein [Acidomonas methanolica]|uniref:DUF768 domain-containing protein n=1 Tax=Acidomonas methanolica NBRC 104435 TaxID=1231351 RepID=A0A023D809_ACIMT|nr:hypothetical protein [Acidomonas methanolica]MBU2653974.1 hypothetical protein [Acidomonas methanolica]TCS30935.1 hypothetical protein EDC31_104130 [Acidomonas methanolica]GAJ29936.1 hypothetical protein Amme_085_064 [Acidomonas methanolica NBRC 104435]GBQ52964.1 hypothetical protein AA0498_1844 [Acidomonas methanolica]GEK98267.1 hypothetical protein AME01nite_07660 [Acidomonas methanolica NBRC 104435]